MMTFDAIHEVDVMTHMPFLTRVPVSPGADAGNDQGKLILFYCRSGLEDMDASNASRRWKLWVAAEGEQPRRLETGLPDELTECSPTAWHDDTGWHVTFVAGGAPGNPLYHLYRMDGPDLDHLSKPVAIHPTRTGFVFGDRLAYADVENLIHVRQPAGDFDIELPGAFICRVSYRADAPDKLLISGQWQTETDVFALEYDLATGEQHLLECDGVPAYKCAILHDQVLYAQRIGEHFEARQIRTSSILSRRPINAALRRQPGQVQPIVTQPTGDCGCRGRSALDAASDAPMPGLVPGSGADWNGFPVTRASCLECVEKHLGAACVLLTETRHGYAHRLRAIGHLHEAEDESQEFPALHDAIRTARKAYQTDGTMPDWEALAQIAGAIRQRIAPAPDAQRTTSGGSEYFVSQKGLEISKQGADYRLA